MRDESTVREKRHRISEGEDDPARAQYLEQLRRERRRPKLTGAAELMKRPGGYTRVVIERPRASA